MTCDFAYVGTGAAEGDPAELALNKDDLTFMNAGEQYTLSVTGAPDGAKITWQSSDESIVTVSENGVLTAKGKGTATVKAAVDDSELTCIVRCNFEDRSGECTISNSDVTMGVKGETFQISLRDADGNKITGLLWVVERRFRLLGRRHRRGQGRGQWPQPMSPRPTTASPTSASCAATSNK